MHVTPRYASPLTPQTFYILLALCQKPAYGYAIARQAAEDSTGGVILTDSTLYSALTRLTATRLIRSIHQDTPLTPGKDRRYYELTDLGREQLTAEQRRLERAAILGRQRLLGPEAWHTVK